MSRRQPKSSYWQDAPAPRDQLVLFAETLEQRIPDDHPVRLIDEVLDQLHWTSWEAKYHGRAGQPPIHPSVLCKILLFAMVRRIRSSRQIEYQLRHSIDFIWLASGRQIDHTTLSEFRRKHQDELKDVYRQLVGLAVRLGVAKLSELCIDGTRVQANASRFHTLKASKVELLLNELNEQLAAALKELEHNDALDELFDHEQPADKLPADLREMKARQEQLKQALAQLQAMDEQRRRDGTKGPAQLPTADHDSRVLPNKEGGYAPNYTPMAVTETENGFIVGADVLIGNVEHVVLAAMMDQIEADYGQKVETVMGDGVYCTGANIELMEEREIELLSPSADASAEADNPAVRDDLTTPVAEEDLDRLPIDPATKRFSKQAFVYDAQTDTYRCPAGKSLFRNGTETVQQAGETIVRTRYRGKECAGCPFANRCRKRPDAAGGRSVSRDEFEAARARHRERMNEDSAKARYKRRQHIGETPFAALKDLFDLRRFLLRGIEGVQTEWLWGCTAFNLKKLAALLGAMRSEAPEPHALGII